jgi:hypothetical protein
MKRSSFYFLFLVFGAIPFLVIGCASNPSPVAVAHKEASARVPVLKTKKEIIFPSPTEAFTVPVKNGDVKSAKLEVAVKLTSAMMKGCQWKQSLAYYGERVVIETQVSKTENLVRARARMDASLCPEKN